MRGLVSMRGMTSGLVVASALCLLTFGCGDDDGDDTTSTGNGDTSTTVTTQPTTTTRPATTTTAAPVDDDDDVEVLVVLNPDGLGFTTPDSGAITHLDFSSDQQLTRNAAVRTLGDPTDEGEQDECPPGPAEIAQFDDKVTLTFMGGAFVGWTITGDSELTTADGIGIGTTLEELTEARPDVEVEQTSLGIEFAAGDLFGTLDGESDDGAIDAMWAGTNCIFR